MEFLANENIPLASVRYLRQLNFSVTSVTESFPSVKDIVVLRYALDHAKIILTFDKDYGELVFRHKQGSHGIVFFRFDPLTPIEPAQRLVELINLKGLDLVHQFTVIDRFKVRQRRLI